MPSQYAAVMGLSKDLKLVGNEFSNIATFLFVGLLCFEVPNSALPVASTCLARERRNSGWTREKKQETR